MTRNSSENYPNPENFGNSFLPPEFLRQDSRLKGFDAEINPYVGLVGSVIKHYKLLKELEVKIDNESEKVNQFKSQLESLLIEIADMADYWESIFSFAEKILNRQEENMINLLENLRQGLQLMRDKLSNIGIEEIAPVTGDKYVAGKHYCIGTKENDRLPDGVVLELVKKGYIRNDELLRPANVILVGNQKEK